jgi:hypothetical protein
MMCLCLSVSISVWHRMTVEHQAHVAAALQCISAPGESAVGQRYLHLLVNMYGSCTVAFRNTCLQEESCCSIAFKDILKNLTNLEGHVCDAFQELLGLFSTERGANAVSYLAR